MDPAGRGRNRRGCIFSAVAISENEKCKMQNVTRYPMAESLASDNACKAFETRRRKDGRVGGGPRDERHKANDRDLPSPRQTGHADFPHPAFAGRSRQNAMRFKVSTAKNGNLPSSSGTTIRPLPIAPHEEQVGGGALLSCFPAFLINQENRRGRREAD